MYKLYFKKIYSYVVIIVKDSSWAEDITQEVFYKAMKTKRKFENRSSEYTWLCAIAKNTCMDELRKIERDRKTVSELFDDVVEMKENNDDEQMLRIHQVLHTLEEPYKEVFQLRIFAELPYKQIAQIFGKTESWARVTYHRAKVSIQERIERDGTENNM